MNNYISSDLYKKQKQIKKRYGLNYLPIIFVCFDDVKEYINKLVNKKVPIFKLKRSESYIITHGNDDKNKMESLGFTNLNAVQ